MQNITTSTPGFENIVTGAQKIREIEKKIYNEADQLPTAVRNRVLNVLANYEYDSLADLAPQIADLTDQIEIAESQVRVGLNRMSDAVGRETAEQFVIHARLFMDSTQ